MNKKETAIMLKCDCGCSMLVVDREEWEDGEVNYNICNRSPVNHEKEYNLALQQGW